LKLRKGPPDFGLFITTMVLAGIGLVMVFSSSAVTAGIWYDDAYYFFKRQLLWFIIGLIAMILTMKLNYQKLKDFAYPALILAVICLLLVLSPLGVVTNGSSRWLDIGFTRFSPAELAKLAMVLVLAKTLDLNLDKIKSFTKGIIPFLLLVGFVTGLVLLQPDLGTAFAIGGTAFCLLIAAGAKVSHLSLIALGGISAVAVAIIKAPYRMERFLAFLDPWKDPTDTGFQIIQSLYALGSGGLFGMGLGRSRQKFFYLPEQYTDFIFAILGEELGFIGAFLVISLFMLLAWRGYKIAINAPDNFGSLLATGVTTMIIFQAAINIGVVSGALPVTGITLPFISHGGTSLLFSMIGVGILLNISRYS